MDVVMKSDVDFLIFDFFLNFSFGHEAQIEMKVMETGWRNSERARERQRDCSDEDLDRAKSLPPPRFPAKLIIACKLTKQFQAIPNLRQMGIPRQRELKVGEEAEKSNV